MSLITISPFVVSNESQKKKETKNTLLETTGEDLIDALYLAASKPNDNLSIGFG